MARGRWKRKKQLVVRNGRVMRFNEKELINIKGYERGPDYVQVDCGCTNKRYGDFIGKLRINGNGQFLITCHCFPGCTTVNVTPDEFEKHAGKEGMRKWKRSIWVHHKNEKVQLWKTPLLKYYTQEANVANWIDVANRKRNFHRDEFIRCSSCNKERRFRLRSRSEIQQYHDALTNKLWSCSDWPYQKITCEDDEERPSRRICRGCPRASLCKGCVTCNCGGCIKCRFVHLNVTPDEFEKHAGKEGMRKWKRSIWVHHKNEKVQLWKTPLLKYYTQEANVANWIDVANRKRNFHRDEFIRCSSCNKERRFRLRSRSEIQQYHDALTNKLWSCSDWPYQKITCEDDEERPSRRICRGCPRASLCKGCVTCNCGGCIKCRFVHCSCQECIDFMRIGEP